MSLARSNGARGARTDVRASGGRNPDSRGNTPKREGEPNRSEYEEKSDHLNGSAMPSCVGAPEHWRVTSDRGARYREALGAQDDCSRSVQVGCEAKQWDQRGACEQGEDERCSRAGLGRVFLQPSGDNRTIGVRERDQDHAQHARADNDEDCALSGAGISSLNLAHTGIRANIGGRQERACRRSQFLFIIAGLDTATGAPVFAPMVGVSGCAPAAFADTTVVSWRSSGGRISNPARRD